MRFKWTDYSFNYFFNEPKFLYLGGKQNKVLWDSTYNHMFSHTRNEYSIFYYKTMWLNYTKKINALRLLYGSNSSFFFLSNRFEHLGVLKSHAVHARAQTFVYERAGQFTKKHGDSADYLWDKKLVKYYGMPNVYKFNDYYRRSNSHVHFTLSSFERDVPFLSEILRHDARSLVIAPADANSAAPQKYLCLFGNNNSLKSWRFYFRLLARSAGNPGHRCDGVSFAAKREEGAAVKSSLSSDHWTWRPKPAFTAAPIEDLMIYKTRSTRSMRGWGLSMHRATSTSLKYDPRAGVFRERKLLKYFPNKIELAWASVKGVGSK